MATEGDLMKSKYYVTINVYWFGLAFLWQGLHPIVLPALLRGFVPETLKNTYLGGMTFAGLVLAMAIQPLAGALSDRTRSRWGRRRPWILAGTVASLLFLVVMALAGSFWGVLVAYLLLQLASNTAHGPAQGLIPDLVPRDRRGLASGLKNLFDMGGLVVTSLVAGQLMSDDNAVLALAVIGVVLAASALVTLLGSPERPTVDEPTSRPRVEPGEARDATSGASPVASVVAALRQYPAYTQLLLSRFLILLGVYAVQAFAQYFIEDRLGLADPEAVTGNLMAAIGLALTLLVFPAGWLSDRIGRMRLNILAGALAAFGLFLLVFARDVFSLYIFGAIIGMATGIFLSVNWALAIDLIPEEEAGKFLGLSNLATAGASAASRLGGPLIDGVNALRPGAFWGYPTLFLLASASTLVGTFLMLSLRRSIRS
jgi:Na+/melibiose symporter-like transporter